MRLFSKEKPKAAAQEWLKGSNLYQLFVGRAREASIREHAGQVFERLCLLDWKNLIQRHGLNLIYLLGVFDNRGPIVVTEEEGERLDMNAPDRLPSPFAISNHTALNPLLGTDKSFGKLVSVIQGCGGRVIVDFVANHTALNHPWVKEHPEYYFKDPASGSGLRHEFSGDVVKLDYGNGEMRDAQLEILRYITELGVDGVRCDMAHLVPVDFWAKAISAVKTGSPGFGFAAEAYSDSVFCWSTLEELLKAGFDGVYHEFLYRNLRNVFVSRQPMEYLAGHLNFVLKYQHRSRLINYMANHDDPLFEQCAPLQEGLMALLMFLPGTTFVYNGQLNGFTRRLKHHRFDPLPEEFSDFAKVPEWFDTMVQIYREKRPLIASIERPGNGLLRCPTYVDGRLGQLVINLGAHPAPAAVPGGKGLLHGLEAGASLKPGQAELFL
jgi:glycosidase